MMHVEKYFGKKKKKKKVETLNANFDVFIL